MVSRFAIPKQIHSSSIFKLPCGAVCRSGSSPKNGPLSNERTSRSFLALDHPPLLVVSFEEGLFFAVSNPAFAVQHAVLG